MRPNCEQELDHIIHKLIVLQNNFYWRWVLYATKACPEFHSMKQIDWSVVLLCTPSGGCPTKHITVIIIHNTNYEKSDWSKAHIQHTLASEADMKTQYLQQIVGSHVEFKICLVFKPWSMHCSQNFCKLREVYSVADCWKMCDKKIIELGLCIILWIIKPCVCMISHAQPYNYPIIVCHTSTQD